MRDEAILVKVLDAQTRLATADAVGQVVDGTVTLAGMLFEVNVKERQPGALSAAGTLISKFPSATASNIDAFVYPDSDLRGVFAERTFFCLPVHEVIWRQTHFMSGLMLTTVDAAKKKSRRIGLWSIVVSNVEKHSRVFGVIIDPQCREQ
jgi:hypothetical protein